MRPTFLGIEVQKRTIQMAQKNLDTTGNNLSNTNTVGYTKQRVDLYAHYISGVQGNRWRCNTNNLALTGQGVNAYGVSQCRDIYVDKRYRENIAIESETEKSASILSEVEDVLDNIENDGLHLFTQNFFETLQDYSVEKPDSKEVATVALNSAVNLCQLLNDYHVQLQEVEDTYVSELTDEVAYVNTLLEEIDGLNQRISKELITYTGEYGPNELYDQLNLYVDELANYADISVRENSNGTFSIDMSGVNVVDGEKFRINRLVMRDYYDYGQVKIRFESSYINGEVTDETFTPKSGLLKSYINMLNGNGVYAAGDQNGEYGIAYFKSAINEFAKTIADTFNAANGADEDASRAMFVSSPDGAYITAGNIHVSDYWMEDPTMIGQTRSYDAATGEYVYGYDYTTSTDEKGNVTLQNTNVIYLLSQFENKSLKFGNANDFEGDIYQYISFVSDRLGEKISYEKSRNDTAVTTVNTLMDARDDVSGVQMDEEGINMLNYQKWYSASSRMLTTLDDCLDKLINGTGRVGL